jgi:hypothetical protein
MVSIGGPSPPARAEGHAGAEGRRSAATGTAVDAVRPRPRGRGLVLLAGAQGVGGYFVLWMMIEPLFTGCSFGFSKTTWMPDASVYQILMVTLSGLPSIAVRRNR